MSRAVLTSPFLLLAMLCASISPASRAAQAAAGPISYYDKIKPILAIHCFKCHGAETAKSHLRLDLSGRARAGGESGKPAIVAGDSGKSELVRRALSNDPDEQMPPKGARLLPHEIELIRSWIDQGAKWPDRDDYWAFSPPVMPAIPTTAHDAALNNPIDRLIEARLEADQIEPSPRADARTLLRRAYADLLGVPPTPDEVRAFLNDHSADAYEKLIDRLLADSRYGERWGRHWLDLVRYGESDGYEDDKIRPHAWRYRDYVIRSFNADKPYDRFAAEQIAGDQLWPDDPDAWVATGFARLGAWDGMSKDPARQRQDFLNDATDAVGAVFLGMTIGCARCHDHKYDRITQRDYYGLQAFFAGAKRESRPLPGDAHDPPAVRREYEVVHAQLTQVKADREALLASARKALEAIAPKPATQKRKISASDINKKAETLQPGQLASLNSKMKDLDRREELVAPIADVIFDAETSPKTFILKGGELARPGELVDSDFIDAMLSTSHAAPATQRSTTRTRADLARWLTSRTNPLFARVMINRIWQHHFGTGIVATPSDFGRNGKQPTDRALLDYLACRFADEKFSIKTMHRLIMTSDAYQRTAVPTSSAIAKDPQDTLLSHQNRRRLEAEAIRDTFLAAAGQLSPAMGGPGVYARLPENVSVELPNNDKELSWGKATEEENRRRSVYLFQRRSLTFPLMDVFDGPAMNQSCPVRAHTTVAPQALALFNGEFSREMAAKFAERLKRQFPDDRSNQIGQAFWITFARPATATELAQSLAFIQKQAKTRGGANAEHAAMIDFCHVLLNANELIYVD